MSVHDYSATLLDAVATARADGEKIRIEGAGTKAKLGRAVEGKTLDVRNHRGVVSFEPTELVITARTGTTIAELDAALAEKGQILPFEPPRFDGSATLGGTLAAGLSGPRRPFAGAARDVVLGVRVITGKGEHLRFGGEVIKNVAGYDVSRLMVGAFGTLGVITEASIKILPTPALTQTVVLETSPEAAIDELDRIAGLSIPLSGLAFADGLIRIRLAGTQAGVASASAMLGGEVLADADAWWTGLRDQSLDFFSGDLPLWRVVVPAATPHLDVHGQWLLDWSGTQRWLRSNADATVIRAAASAVGGHATCYSGHASEPFHPLTDGIARLHSRLKDAFDPDRIMNVGRMYADT